MQAAINQDQGFYTLAEVASQLHVSKMTIYRAIRSKKLSAYKLGRDYRIQALDLQAFLSSLKVS